MRWALWTRRSSTASAMVELPSSADASKLERVVSEVRVCESSHALFGLTLPVVSTRS